MPTYTFSCPASDHGADPRQFTLVIQHREGKRIDQAGCPICGATAKRDLVADLATVNQVGSTPIAVSDSKHTIGHELEFAFGKFKRNPDGSADKNHSPFRDTGEMSRFMAGQNELGEPVVGDNGKPVRRRDGSLVRRGAKMFKYGPNSTPSKDGVCRRGPVRRRLGGIEAGWGNAREAEAARGTRPEAVPILHGVERVAMRERRAR